MGSFFQTAGAAIAEARGLDMTFAGLTITFSALGTIAICISLLPALMKTLSKIYPEKVAKPAPKPASSGVTDEIVAAIGLALHSLKSDK